MPINGKRNRKNTTSKFIGVSFVNNINKYNASVIMNYKKINLGYFENEIEAAETRDAFIAQHNLKNYSLNFPDKIDEYLTKEKIIQIVVKKPPETGFTGVTMNKSSGKYRVKHVGTFETALLAGKAYDNYIVTNNIPHKTLNFPEDHPDYDPNSEIKTFFEDLGNDIYEINNDNILISKESYDKIKNYNVYISDNYALINYKDNITYRLNRFLMDVTDPDIWIDHKNNNPLDNTLSNLRYSNSALNAQNKIKQKNTSSKYMGVCINNKGKSFISYITNDQKRIFSFGDKDEVLCARARDLFMIKYLSTCHYKKIFDDWENDGIFDYWNIKLKDRFEKYKDFSLQSSTKVNNIEK